jgi:hypothetical protein
MPEIKCDIMGDSVKIDTFRSSVADTLSGRYFATSTIVCVLASPVQVLHVIAAWLTCKTCVIPSKLSTDLQKQQSAEAQPDIVVVSDDDDNTALFDDFAESFVGLPIDQQSASANSLAHSARQQQPEPDLSTPPATAVATKQQVSAASSVIGASEPTSASTSASAATNKQPVAATTSDKSATEPDIGIPPVTADTTKQPVSAASSVNSANEPASSSRSRPTVTGKQTVCAPRPHYDSDATQVLIDNAQAVSSNPLTTADKLIWRLRLDEPHADIEWRYVKDFPYTVSHEQRLRHAQQNRVQLQQAMAVCPGLVQFLPFDPKDPEYIEHVKIVAELNDTPGFYTSQIRWVRGETFQPHQNCIHCCCKTLCSRCEHQRADWAGCCSNCVGCYDEREQARQQSLSRSQPAPTVVPLSIVASLTDSFTPSATSSNDRSGARTPPGSCEGSTGGSSRATTKQQLALMNSERSNAQTVQQANKEAVTNSVPSQSLPTTNETSPQSVPTPIETSAKTTTTAKVAIPVQPPQSAVPSCGHASKPFRVNDHVIVTVPGIPELQNVKAIVLETGLMTAKNPDVYIRVKPLISSPDFTTVKTKQSYVLHDLETNVQQTPSPQSRSGNPKPPATSKSLKRRATQRQQKETPSTPTKQTTKATTRSSTQLAPSPKRQRVSFRQPVPSASLCDFGDIPSISGILSASSLLVPFIHAVAIKVSNITNEIAVGRRVGSRPSEFRFKYSEFRIRTPENEAEFDYLVDTYAAEYVANGITRAAVYTQFCNSMGYIGPDDQERLTDPFHKRTFVPNIDKDTFEILSTLA